MADSFTFFDKDLRSMEVLEKSDTRSAMLYIYHNDPKAEQTSVSVLQVLEIDKRRIIPTLTMGFEDQKRERSPSTNAPCVLDRELRFTESDENDGRLQRSAMIYILIGGQTQNKHEIFVFRFWRQRKRGPWPGC